MLCGILMVILLVVFSFIGYYGTMAIHDDIVQTKIERIQKERL